jgi:hypothetical protein
MLFAGAGNVASDGNPVKRRPETIALTITGEVPGGIGREQVNLLARGTEIE